MQDDAPEADAHETVLAAVVAVAGDETSTTGAVESLTRAGGRPRHSEHGRVVLFDGPATAVRAATAATRAGGSAGVVVAEVLAHDDHVPADVGSAAHDLARSAPVSGVHVSQVAAMLMSATGVQLRPVETAAGGSVHAVVA